MMDIKYKYDNSLKFKSYIKQDIVRKKIKPLEQVFLDTGVN